MLVDRRQKQCVRLKNKFKNVREMQWSSALAKARAGDRKSAKLDDKNMFVSAVKFSSCAVQ